jgi:hypothetical protein
MNIHEMHKVAGSAKEMAMFLPKQYAATGLGRLGGMLGGAVLGGGAGALYDIGAGGVDNIGQGTLMGALGGAGVGRIAGGLAGHGLGVKWNGYPLNARNYLTPMAGALPGSLLAAYGAYGSEEPNMPLVAGGFGLGAAGMLGSRAFMKK